MKSKLILLIALLSFSVPSITLATLVTIGTATYGDSDYNLIWDDDNNGNSVVWLDYTNALATWAAQNAWVTGLDSVLTYNIDSLYKVSWFDDNWRLGSTVDGEWSWGYDGTTTLGFNITNSEMGHLYYEELGNLGYNDMSGNYQDGFGLQSTGDFENLVASEYWSGTKYENYTDHFWKFNAYHGSQGYGQEDEGVYGLAVRSGQVSTVPEPTTFFLLGSGLVGLAWYGRKRRKA